jgi:hypothetical protein
MRGYILFPVTSRFHLPARRQLMRLSFGIVCTSMGAVLGCAAQPASRAAPDARSVELGTTMEELVWLLGAPSRTRDAARGDLTFRTFDYPNGLSCVVDLATYLVCKVSVGETDGYCY